MCKYPDLKSNPFTFSSLSIQPFEEAEVVDAVAVLERFEVTGEA